MPLHIVILIIVLVIAILVLAERYIIKDPTLRTALRVLVLLVLVVWLIQLLIPGVTEVRVGG